MTSKAETIDTQDLANEIPQAKNLKGLVREFIEIIEKRTILDALSKTGGNVTQAAKALGISRATLQNKMKTYGLRNSKE